jgi:hypothetical protein
MAVKNPAIDDAREIVVGVCFSCPYCGEGLTQLPSEGRWRFYNCNNCGRDLVAAERPDSSDSAERLRRRDNRDETRRVMLTEGDVKR